MAIIIDIKQNFVPVKIGDLKYKFYLDDKSLEKLLEQTKKLEDMEQNLEQDKLTDGKEALIKTLDLFLESGAGQAIYELCGESTIILMKVFVDLSKELAQEVLEQQSPDFKRLDNDVKKAFIESAMQTNLAEEDEAKMQIVPDDTDKAEQ